MNKLTTMFLLAFAGGTSATAAGAPEGLYLMTRIQGSALNVSTYWFHDGAVVRNPGVSAKNLDLPGERALHPNSVGTYALAGGQLTLTFPGSNIKSRFEADATGGGFGWDAGAFVPVEIFKPGSTLEGTYSGGSSTGGGALMGSTSVTFGRDGTYVSDSATSFASQGRSSGASGESVSKVSGKYRIDGTALQMMPNGGKETVVMTFPYDDGTPGLAPGSVYYGAGMMNRQK